MDYTPHAYIVYCIQYTKKIVTIISSYEIHILPQAATEAVKYLG
jgi:hypothetical protein